MKFQVLFLTLLCFNAHTTSMSGFYIGAGLGGSYLHSLKEYIRHKSQNSDNETELFCLSQGFSIVVNLHGGCGYQLQNGLYFGGQVYGFYDFSTIDSDSADAKMVVKKNLILDTKQVVTLDYEVNKLKPFMGFGCAFHIGFRIMLNMLAYLGIGFDKTHISSKQAMMASDLAIINDFGGEKTFKTKDATGKDINISLVTTPIQEIKVNILSFVPSIGLRVFLKPNLYACVQIEALKGFDKQVDPKYYDENFEAKIATTNEGTFTMKSLRDYESFLYMNRKFALRYGINIGYKF